MIYGDSQSPFDLRFRLLGFPVRVSPIFFIFSALIGSGLALQLGWQYLVLWVGLSFMSILLHEMGHALAYRLFGSPAEITLHGFGGYAIGHPPRQPWKRMLISLAGPVAQFILAGILYVSALLTDWPIQNNYFRAAFTFLMWMNIFWPLFNLLPMLPLDGGNVMREVLVMLRLRNPDAIAHALSVGVAGLLVLRGVAALANFKLPIIDDYLPTWLVPGQMMTFFFVMFAIENAQMYQRYRRSGGQNYYDAGYDGDVPPWRRR